MVKHQYLCYTEILFLFEWKKQQQENQRDKGGFVDVIGQQWSSSLISICESPNPQRFPNKTFTILRGWELLMKPRLYIREDSQKKDTNNKTPE